MLSALEADIRDLEDGQQIGVVAVGGDDGLIHFCMDECDEEMCCQLPQHGELLLLTLLCDTLFFVCLAGVIIVGSDTSC